MPALKVAESDLSRATRRSIKKLFPVGFVTSAGLDNPITLHAVNHDAFARVWSLFAETMMVQIELSRSTKEEIAGMISQHNACPVCLAVHNFMGITAIVVDQKKDKKDKKRSNSLRNSDNTTTTINEDEEEEAKKKKANDKQLQHDQAIEYAEMLLSEMKKPKRISADEASTILSAKHSVATSHSGGSGGNKSFVTARSSTEMTLSAAEEEKAARKSRKRLKRRFTHLNATARAEVALVIMLFDHMNRVVSVILGDELSTAMFGVPRSIAKAVEKPSAIKAMARWLAPFSLVSATFKTKNQPGVTLGLFPDAQNGAAKTTLPDNVQGVVLAGLERANAVGRLVDWVHTFEKDTLLKNDIVSRHLIRFLDRKVELPLEEAINFSSPQEVADWMDRSLKDKVTAEIMGDESEIDEVFGTERAIALVVLLASFAPQTAYQSSHWDDLVKRVGVSMARSIMIWWSLRRTLKVCKGLDEKVDQRTMMSLINTGLQPQ